MHVAIVVPDTVADTGQWVWMSCLLSDRVRCPVFVRWPPTPSTGPQDTKGGARVGAKRKRGLGAAPGEEVAFSKPMNLEVCGFSGVKFMCSANALVRLTAPRRPTKLTTGLLFIAPSFAVFFLS